MIKMGMHKYVAETFRSEYSERNALLRSRLAAWGKEPPIVRIKKPTNIARARELGYRAKQGVIVARVSVRRGLRKRPKPMGGRKPSKSGRFFAREKSLQAIAEERAARRFSNCEVLNSYFVGSTGSTKFFEVILLDKSHPAIANDKRYAGIISQNGRVYRGLTSAAKKHRGITRSGFGTSKNKSRA
ncbi:MAG: 50S ribosomal protein L15e [Candidatus Micrarchaeaceae archaeon]